MWQWVEPGGRGLGSVGGSSCSPRVPEMLVSETERDLDSGTSDTTDSAGEKRERLRDNGLKRYGMETDHGRRGRASRTGAIPALRQRQLDVSLTHQHNTLILSTDRGGGGGGGGK